MILVFGYNGQIARCLRDLTQSNNDFQFVSSSECNFSNPQNVDEYLNNLQQIPSFIINASAYTKVDDCEINQEEAFNVNGYSVGVIANYCKKNNIKLIHYSTDYVFDGEGVSLYKTIDKPNPINTYGKSKLLGEELAIASGCEYYIIRTSWVYSEYGVNFLKTMLNLMVTKNEISVVSDQIGSPTYALDIAKITLDVITGNYDSGIYHFTNEGFCSWYDFAMQIFYLAQELSFPVSVQKIHAILTKDYPRPAPRPLNSRLDKGILSGKLTPWQVSLKKAMIALKNITH